MSTTASARSERRRKPRIPPRLLVTVVAVGALNFLGYMVETAVLGGSAVNGVVRDGHYYLRAKVDLIEVSRDVFMLNLIHGVATFVSWPFVMLEFGAVLFRYVFPVFAAGKNLTADPSRLVAVEASGPALWSGSPGGIVGQVHSSVGMFGASIHPGGVVVRPRFMPPSAVLAGEIRDVRFGRRMLTPTVEIDHAGIDVASPVVLYGSPSSAHARALELMLRNPRASAEPERPDSDIRSDPPAIAPRTDGASVIASMEMLGVLAGVAILVVGLVVVIPELGVPGMIWTAVGGVIAVSNLRRVWSRR